MKVLNLQCAAGHGFEGWFASNEAFDSQRERGLVTCPVCGDSDIDKLLSAPRLNLGAGVEPKGMPASAAASSPEARWRRAVHQIIAATEDVGERFTDEARRIHYGEAEERGIRGLATRAQTEALIDEGIAVLPLPLADAIKETLH